MANKGTDKPCSSSIGRHFVSRWRVIKLPILKRRTKRFAFLIQASFQFSYRFPTRLSQFPTWLSVIINNQLVLIVINARARADQITVSVNVIDTVYGWPVF